jgi:hypothetical protein
LIHEEDAGFPHQIDHVIRATVQLLRLNSSEQLAERHCYTGVLSLDVLFQPNPAFGCSVAIAFTDPTLSP